MGEKGTAHIGVEICSKSESLYPWLFNRGKMEFPIFLGSFQGFTTQIPFKQGRIFGVTRWGFINFWVLSHKGTKPARALSLSI